MTVFACTTAKLVFARKNLPETISHKIIMMVYKAEHAEKRDHKLLPVIRAYAAARAARRVDTFPEYAEQVIRVYSTVRFLYKPLNALWQNSISIPTNMQFQIEQLFSWKLLHSE